MNPTPSDKRVITIELDGDQYCALLGTDLMEGVCGFGPTIDDAIEAFCESWISASPSERKKAIESGDVKLSEEVYKEVIDWIRGLWSELLASLPDDVETIEHLCIDIRPDRSFVSEGSLDSSQSDKTFIEGRFPKDIQMSCYMDIFGDWRFRIAHPVKNLDLNGRMAQVVIGKFCKEWTDSSSVQ